MKKYFVASALIFILFIPFSLKSQTLDSIYKNDKLYILGKENGINRSILTCNHDHDNKWLWLYSSDTIKKYYAININDKMQILDNISTPNYFAYKHNNKLYGLNVIYGTDSIGNGIIDSLYFGCHDIKNNIYNTYNIPDTLVEYINMYSFLKQKEFAVISTPFPGAFFDTVTFGNLNYFKIAIFDTIGNLLRYKTIQTKLSNIFSIVEHNNYIVLSKIINGITINNKKTYFINKETLEIEDSIDGYYQTMKSINDTLLIGIHGFKSVYIDIINTNTKSKINLDYVIDSNFSEYFADISNYLDNISFKSIDSIYFSYIVRKHYQGNFSGYLEVMNFNSNGNINFRYKFDDYKPEHEKYLSGTQATEDGGIIMTLCSSPQSYPYKLESWIIKFNPNGIVGLSNVESGEKASLRVYPNPAKDFVLVDIEADKFDKADIEIYDLNGKMVKKSKLSAKVGNRVDVSSLKAGVYSYRVVLNGKGVSGKIVIGE